MAVFKPKAFCAALNPDSSETACLPTCARELESFVDSAEHVRGLRFEMKALPLWLLSGADLKSTYLTKNSPRRRSQLEGVQQVFWCGAVCGSCLCTHLLFIVKHMLDEAPRAQSKHWTNWRFHVRTSQDGFFVCLFALFYRRETRSAGGFSTYSHSFVFYHCFSFCTIFVVSESSMRVVLCDFLIEGLLTQLLASLQENVFYKLVCKDFYCRHVRYVH